MDNPKKIKSWECNKCCEKKNGLENQMWHYKIKVHSLFLLMGDQELDLILLQSSLTLTKLKKWQNLAADRFCVLRSLFLSHFKWTGFRFVGKLWRPSDAKIKSSIVILSHHQQYHTIICAIRLLLEEYWKNNICTFTSIVVLCFLLPLVLLLIFHSIYSQFFWFIFISIFIAIVHHQVSFPLRYLFFCFPSMMIFGVWFFVFFFAPSMLFNSLPFSNSKCSSFLPFRFIWYIFLLFCSSLYFHSNHCCHCYLFTQKI